MFSRAGYCKKKNVKFLVLIQNLVLNVKCLNSSNGARTATKFGLSKLGKIRLQSIPDQRI